MARRRSLQRSIQDRTWERDLEPVKQIEVTKASVLGTRGSLTPNDNACDSIALKWGCRSASGALARIKRRISRAEDEYGVSTASELES